MQAKKVIGTRYIVGKPADWFKGECMSTHGCAGPYTNPCQYCGATVRREEIIEEREGKWSPN